MSTLVRFLVTMNISDRVETEDEIELVLEFVETRLSLEALQVFYQNYIDCCLEDALLYAVLKEMENT